MNRIDHLFENKKKQVLNIYCTAGYPALTSTVEVITALQEYGADVIEIGIPYSDPLADGPVIQHSNMIAIKNGMSIDVLFKQIEDIRLKVQLPLILMGYMNPVLQYGFEKFCADAQKAGIDGLIIPDLPVFEFDMQYKAVFEKHGLKFIFLITPETTEERIKQIDERCSGFIYAVSSSSTTGNNKAIGEQTAYFEKLRQLKLKNPVLVGFGIKDRETFNTACQHTNGAIIGSAFIKALENSTSINQTVKKFINSITE